MEVACSSERTPREGRNRASPRNSTLRNGDVPLLWKSLKCSYHCNARILEGILTNDLQGRGERSDFQVVMTTEIRSDLLLCFASGDSIDPVFGPKSLQGCAILAIPDANNARALRISFSGEVTPEYLTLEPISASDLTGLTQACNNIISHPVLLQEFDPVACVGKGKWGKVSVCRRPLSQQEQRLGLFAVKEIALRNKRIVKLVQNELLVMKSLGKCPFVVHLQYAIQQGRHAYLIMEFAPGGDLHTLLRKHCIRARDTLFYASELALALEHCHSVRIVHRDLKPENLLISADGHLKLADFGLAKPLPLGSLGTQTLCGTEVYAAPEMLRMAAPYGYSVDFWQFGCYIYELFCGHSPFSPAEADAPQPQQPRDLILAGAYSIPERVPSAARDLIARLLTQDPADRLGCPPGALGSDRPGEGWRAVRAHRMFRSVPWAAAARGGLRPPVVNVADGADVLENFSDEFLWEDAGFCGEVGAATPCDEELLGFYYHPGV
mmetsp:Transcript_2109/g.3375  ORF Transcript_2109/g.3375 Transcript_2109/m.3375 type:complete len:495 (+) Transcript_2109:132-1616(+)